MSDEAASRPDGERSGSELDGVLPGAGLPGSEPGRSEFERYGLVAALTLVGLCLLLADRMRPSRAAAPVPPSDRLLRVRIGGNAPPAPVQRPRPLSQPQPQPQPQPARPGTPQPRSIAQERAPAPPPMKMSDLPPEPATAPRTCVVASGETLGDIALRELGTSRRAKEIAALNGLEDVGRIREGQTLRIPVR